MDDLSQSILQHLKVGKKLAIHQDELAKSIGLTNSNEKREMRQAITDMRHDGKYWILSCPNGYYLAESLDEIKEARAYWLSYIKSLCINLRDLKYMEHNFTGQLPMNFKE